MIKLAIFDLDGTLLNTIEDLGTACNHALKMCGYPERDMCEYNTLVGRGIYNLFMGALPQSARTEKEVMRMKTHFIPFYDEHKCDRTRPYNGIYGMLDRLNENGIRLAVASNKYQDGTEKLVRRFFGKYSFVRILGQRDGMPIKPDPMIVTEAMSAAGISDKADVRTAGVTWGFRTREELKAYRPWAIADSPDQLCRLILEA